LTFHKGMSYVSAGFGIARMEALAALGRMMSFARVATIGLGLW
jgi:hypothetical protein